MFLRYIFGRNNRDMKHLTIFFAAVALLASAFKTVPAGYQINGTVVGLADGTWLYLRTAKPDRDIDSCRVNGGKFSMNGQIAEKATPVYLHTAKYTNYVHFWLENTIININVKAGEFKKGRISGSATQDEDKRLDALRLPFNIKADSLSQVLEQTKDSITKKNLAAQIRELDGKIKQVDQGWIKANPGSLISANLLDIYATTWGRETTAALYQDLSVEMKATGYGQDINEYLLVNKSIKIGDTYADFEQANTQGKPVKLSQVKGKYILLDFWASWCGPCREENPKLAATYARFKDKGFAVLGVSLDENKKQWLQAIKTDQLMWENVCDLRGDKNQVALMYGINAIPNNFLIDSKGVVIARNLRGEKLDEALEKLLE